MTMYPDGSPIEATCDAHDVTGTLAGDHDDLDGIVSIREADTGEVLRLNGWLWLFETAQDHVWPAER